MTVGRYDSANSQLSIVCWCSRCSGHAILFGPAQQVKYLTSNTADPIESVNSHCQHFCIVQYVITAGAMGCSLWSSWTLPTNTHKMDTTLVESAPLPDESSVAAAAEVKY